METIIVKGKGETDARYIVEIQENKPVSVDPIIAPSVPILMCFGMLVIFCIGYVAGKYS